MVLWANLKPSKTHIKIREYSTYRLIFGLFLKLKKFMVRQWNLPNHFASKTQRILLRYCFFLAACNKKFQRANATDIAKNGHDPLDDCLKAGWARDSQTHTRLVDSLICITCSLEKNAFSVLYCVMAALHYSLLHRFEIFSAPETIKHGSIRLPPRSLASSRDCSLEKIKVTYVNK